MTERTAYILKVRQLAVGVAQAYVEAMRLAPARSGGERGVERRTQNVDRTLGCARALQ